MEFLERKLVTEFSLCRFAKLYQLQFANHVRARLSRCDYVPFGLARADAVVDRLLASPSLGVQTRVYYQTACAKKLTVEGTQLTGQVAIVPSMVKRELLRI